MMGEVEVPVKVGDRNIAYRFARAKDAPFKCSVNCSLSLESPHNYSELVKNAVIDYFNSLEIGDTITQPALSQYIMRNASNFSVDDVKVARKDTPMGYAPIVLNLDELATISASDIDVSATE